MKIEVKVIPNSSKKEVLKISDKEYKVYLNKAPEKNKANEELVKTLKNYFNRKVSIYSGLTSRRKIIEVSDG